MPGDPPDLVPGLVDGGGRVDAEHPARPTAGVLERGEAGDHPGVRRAGDRADDDRCRRRRRARAPARRPRTPSRRSRGRPAGVPRHRPGCRTACRPASSTSRSASVQDARMPMSKPAGSSRESAPMHAGEQQVADVGVAGLVPVDPVLLDEAAAEPEVRGDGGDLAGVVGLVAADGDERVRARRQDVGDDVLELAGLVPAVREPAAAVLPLGPDLRAAEVLGQAAQRVDRARPERQRVAREVSEAHGRTLPAPAPFASRLVRRDRGKPARDHGRSAMVTGGLPRQRGKPTAPQMVGQRSSFLTSVPSYGSPVALDFTKLKTDATRPPGVSQYSADSLSTWISATLASSGPCGQPGLDDGVPQLLLLGHVVDDRGVAADRDPGVARAQRDADVRVRGDVAHDVRVALGEEVQRTVVLRPPAAPSDGRRRRRPPRRW